MNQLDELVPKLKAKQETTQKKKETDILEQFQEIYEIAKQIKSEHEKVNEHKNKLKTIIDNLQIHESLISQMQNFVDQETHTKQVLNELETLFEKVSFEEKEHLMLDAEREIRVENEQLGIGLFEKILRKIEIFEALKEIETMKETSQEAGTKQNQTTVHISSVISAKEDMQNTQKSQSQGYFSSFWNLSKYLTSDKVNNG